MSGSSEPSASAEERYGTFWRETPESLFTVRVLPDGSFRYDGLNPAHEKRIGISNAELEGRSPHEVLSPEAAEAVTGRYRRCVELGQALTYEETLELPAGRRHWETSLAPPRDETGRIHLLLGSARDVTERIEMRDALLDSETRLRTVTDLVPDILFSAPLGSGPDYVSPRFFEYSGLPEGSTGRECLEALHPEDLEVLLAAARAEDARRLELEVRVRARDGEYRWFLVRGVKEVGPNRWFGVATDVHDMKLAAERIESLNARLNVVLSSVSDGYCTMDREWRMTSLNGAAAAWMGRGEDLLIGKDIRTWLKEDAPLRVTIQRALETGAPGSCEAPSMFRPERWVEFHIYPAASGASIFFRDVTDRRVEQLKVEAAHALLQGSLDAMNAEIALLDAKGVIIAVNAAWRQMMRQRGSPRADAGVGADYLEVSRETVPDFDEIAIGRALRDMQSGRRTRFTHSPTPTVAGGLRWRRLSIASFLHGQELHFVASWQDVTETIEAREALRKTTERLLAAQEEERHRIAIELHDSTSQHLVALGLGVSSLQRTLTSEEGARLLLEEMAGSVGEALKEIRVLSYLLNPPTLERDGLSTVVRSFVEGVGRRTGLHTALRMEGRVDDVPAEVQRTIYRVVQEALANVHRHAKAQGVEIDLTRRGRMVRISVFDDGCGVGDLDLSTSGDVRLGVGIPGMKARVEQLGGEFQIQNDVVGTRLTARLPLPGRRGLAAPSAPPVSSAAAPQ